MSQKLIDVSKLNQTLITYDKALRALPFATLQEVAAKLGLNVMDLQGNANFQFDIQFIIIFFIM